ncbi:MAG: helix-turn-helix transcriptional regulator [Sphingomonadaceae bacterium]|nr:helix-turn-helix transcriptional regulator [Sphingomonadaceae bacterium]
MGFPLLNPETGAALIDAVENRDFGKQVLEAAQGLAMIDEVFAYYAEHESHPVVIASSSAIGAADQRAQIYAERFYRFDPAAYDRAATPVGKGVASLVSAAQIEPKDYRAICFDGPAIVAKYFYGWNAPDAWYVMNFYARRTSDKATLALLSQLAGISLSAMVRHRKRQTNNRFSLADLEQRLARQAKALTQREQAVCARTLAGMSAQQIATDLGISRNSVLTYRQRAYKRYDISSAGGLLAFVLS